MMTPELRRSCCDPAAGDGVMGLFEELSKEEILDVLSEGFCQHCRVNFEHRIQDVLHSKVSAMSLLHKNGESSPESFMHRSMTPIPIQTPESFPLSRQIDFPYNSVPALISGKQYSNHCNSEIMLSDGVSGVSSRIHHGMPEEQKDQIRFSQVGREKDFVHIERMNGKSVNVVEGLELYTRVFNAEEQKNIVERVYDLQCMGQMGRLRERTYTEPRKWMRGKGRVTIQFGCCYNYAVELDMHYEAKWDDLENNMKFKKHLENERLYEFLAGFNKELDEVCGRILGRRPLPSIGEAFVEARREAS